MATDPRYPIDPEDHMFLYELLHGGSLASRLFQEVCASGDPREAVVSDDGKETILSEKKDLFEKYPELGAARDQVDEALAHFYQICGSHYFKAAEEKEETP